VPETLVANQQVTVFIEADDNAEAVAVTEYDGTGDITGVVLYEGHLTIGSDNSVDVDNDALADYDYSVSTNENVFHDVDASNNLEACVLTGCESVEIYIKSGNTYRPNSGGGDHFSTHDIENDGSLVMDSNTASISGSWNNDANFVAGTSTIYMTASDSVETIDSTGGADPFYNLKLGDSATTSYTAEWDLSSALDVNGDLTIDAGTLDQNGANTINMAMDLLIETNGSFTKGDGVVTFDGTTGPYTWIDNATTKSDMGDVSINGTTLTVALGSDVKALTVNVAASQILDLGDSSYKLTISDGGVNPITVTGTLDTGADSEVEFIASASPAPYINTISYHDLTLASSGTTFYSNGDTTVSGSFNIEEGTFDAETHTWTLKGTGTPFAVSGTFVADSSTFNYAGNGATTIASTSETDMGSYYNLQIGNDTTLGSANTYTLSGTTTTTNVLTVGPTSGNVQTLDVSASNHSLVVQSNLTINQSASVSARSGTVTLSGAASATLADNSTGNDFEPYNLTINKTSADDANDNLTLAGSASIVRNTLTITDGDLIQGNINVTAEGSSAVVVAVLGYWQNIGTGDLTLGGSFANAGSVSFDTNGSGCTNVADSIVIASTDGATQRTWTSSPMGTYIFHNVAVSYQTGTDAISVYDGTNSGNNGTNWTFLSCDLLD